MALKLSDAYQSSPIKSIQRGSTVVSGTAANVAIAAVDASKATVNISVKNDQYQRFYDFDGTSSGPEGEAASAVFAGAYLLDATTLRFERGEGGGSPVVFWEVIEYV